MAKLGREGQAPFDAQVEARIVSALKAGMPQWRECVTHADKEVRVESRGIKRTQKVVLQLMKSERGVTAKQAAEQKRSTQ